MALQVHATLNVYGGLNLPAAYLRVAEAKAYKALVGQEPGNPASATEVLCVSYRGEIHLDQAARQARATPLDFAAGTFPWDASAQPNILAACYAHLKAQEAYAAATDC
jgi:hypothetical protein